MIRPWNWQGEWQPGDIAEYPGGGLAANAPLPDCFRSGVCYPSRFRPDDLLRGKGMAAGRPGADMMETPVIASATYAPTAYMLNAAGGLQNAAQNWAQFNQLAQNQVRTTTSTGTEPKPMPNPSRRLVQVFICDPNENVPLDKSLLYSGELKLTDLTDQELFFEIDIKTILTEHNAARTKMVDKAVKERTDYLEPARIRDLKMTVVNVATF